MSTLYIAEIDQQSVDLVGLPVIAASVPSLAEQVVAIGAGSTQSAMFNNETRFVELHTDVACSVLFGEDPQATTSNRRMGANETRYFSLKRPRLKVAVILNP